MPRVRETLSPKDLARKRFKTVQTDGLLKLAIGIPELGFSMIVYGQSGAGKSTFVMWLVKELSKIGKCYFNSVEMGAGLALQKMIDRHAIGELDNNKFTIGDRHTVEQMDKVLETNRAMFVFIDSIDFLEISTREFKQLKQKYPSKCFIVISHTEGGKPKSRAGKAIEYFVDIKCKVIDGVAFVKSRFGETEPIYINPGIAELSTKKEVMRANEQGFYSNAIFEKDARGE